MARKTTQRKKTSKKTKGKARRTGPVMSFKDVIMAYYVGGQGRGGIRAIKKEAEQKQVKLTSKVLWAAYDSLAEAPDCNLEDLETFIVQTVGERTDGSRGRSQPKSGESRNYKAMTSPVKDKDGKETGRSDPFVRIPVSTLGVEGGAQLQANFEDGRIVLTPVPQS